MKPQEIENIPEKAIAIFVPAWYEADIIDTFPQTEHSPPSAEHD